MGLFSSNIWAIFYHLHSESTWISCAKSETKCEMNKLEFIGADWGHF